MAKQYAKQLTATYQKGFEEGLWNGEMLMIDIYSVALYNCDGYGKTNHGKWDRLGAEIQRINDELMSSDKGEVEVGFEHLINALAKIFGEDRRSEFEHKYRKLIYERNEK